MTELMLKLAAFLAMVIDHAGGVPSGQGVFSGV